MVALAGKAAAQEQSSVYPKVCEGPPVNVATGAESRECRYAAPSAPDKIGCCYVAPQVPRKECFADKFQLVLPLPYRATQAILSANGALVLGPGSSVRAKHGANGVIVFGEISNLGGADTILGADASVGSLFSNAKVTLGEGVTVNGSVTAGGMLVVPTSAVLKGQVTTNTHIPGVEPPLATVKFSTEPAVDVPGGLRRMLGRFGETRVDSGGTLSLTAGTYCMTSLTVPAARRSIWTRRCPRTSMTRPIRTRSRSETFSS
jgi:hypothetical protein